MSETTNSSKTTDSSKTASSTYGTHNNSANSNSSSSSCGLNVSSEKARPNTHPNHNYEPISGFDRMLDF